MTKPVENFYEKFFESNRGYAWKQDLNILNKHVLKNKFVVSFMHSQLRTKYKEDYMKFGESKVGRLDYSSNFHPFSSPDTHKIITKILQHTKNVFFANLTKNRYNFDSFTPDGYCYVGLAVVIF